jgi:hypothetical protein
MYSDHCLALSEKVSLRRWDLRIKGIKGERGFYGVFEIMIECFSLLFIAIGILNYSFASAQQFIILLKQNKIHN